MKINVEFDMTPEELREALGLPNVEEFQKELMNTMLEKMKNGETGYDASSLFEPFINTSMKSMELFKKSFMDAMNTTNNNNKT